MYIYIVFCSDRCAMVTVNLANVYIVFCRDRCAMITRQRGADISHSPVEDVGVKSSVHSLTRSTRTKRPAPSHQRVKDAVGYEVVI